jgi:hypothetical protein
MANVPKRVLRVRQPNGTLRTVPAFLAMFGVLYSCTTIVRESPRAGEGTGGSNATGNIGLFGGSTSPDPGRAAGGDDDLGASEGGATSEGPSSLDCELVAEQATAVLTEFCAKCHGPGTNVAMFDYVLDPAALESNGKIKPGDATGSPLHKRMALGEMPPATAAKKPSTADVRIIYDWIESCRTPAKPDSQYCGDPYIETDTMLEWMNEDIAETESRDRPFIRYFSLAHTHNAGACQDELDIYRFALAKALNVLSRGTQIVKPEAIDPQETVYRIDIRDYEWDASGARAYKWEVLVDNNPYAFVLEDDDADILRTLTQTQIPFQSADWFVDVATRAPLYHDMLDTPASLGELEDILDIDIADNIGNQEVDRAGFLDSGVSVRNRVIERHQLPTASTQALWIAYDFAGDGGRENIFTNPLDFQFDAAEMFYSLPNGLHAYMVIDGAGRRLDAQPNSIVVDPRQPDNVVTNGISCISCHNNGMKSATDELREFVDSSSDFNNDDAELVADLHPQNDDFADIIERDGRNYLSALAELSPPADSNAEPIIEVFDRFEANVDLDQAAAELGIEPKALLSSLGQLNPALSPLQNGSIKRETFRDLFAETVCLLNLGLADDPACN